LSANGQWLVRLLTVLIFLKEVVIMQEHSVYQQKEETEQQLSNHQK